LIKACWQLIVFLRSLDVARSCYGVRLKQSDDGIGNTFGSVEAVGCEAFQSRVVRIGKSKALIGSAIRLTRVPSEGTFDNQAVTQSDAACILPRSFYGLDLRLDSARRQS
jgi:hypothetical protein